MKSVVDCHIRDLIPFILSSLELSHNLGESLERVLHVFHRVCRRRYDAENDHALRYYRIYDYGAEYAVVLAEVLGNVRGFHDSTLYSHRSNAGLGRPYLQAHVSEPFLECPRDGEELLAELIPLCAADDFKSLESAFHKCHRK